MSGHQLLIDLIFFLHALPFYSELQTCVSCLLYCYLDLRPGHLVNMYRTFDLNETQLYFVEMVNSRNYFYGVILYDIKMLELSQAISFQKLRI